VMPWFTATVPSWQLKQARDGPLGWPTVAFNVGLLYGVNDPEAEVACDHSGAT
jgi:hypothetical protein